MLETADKSNESSGKSKKHVIAKTTLPFAELSLFMQTKEDGKPKSSSLAVEMDFIAPNEAGLNVTQLVVEKVSDSLEDEETNKKQLPEKRSHYNLLSDNYNDKLILSMEFDFNMDVVIEAKQFKALKHVKNQFSMPEVVEHKDYINDGFDAMMRKQKKAKEQQKIQKNQSRKTGKK